MITLYNEIDERLKLISVFEFNDADMGESSISATVSFDEEQNFHPDWYVIYNGEKFRLGVRKPTGKKDTSSLSTTYTLVFKSEREDLKRYTFMDFVELGTGNPQPSSYNVSLYATLSEFVDRFNTNLRYYMGSRWQMVLPVDYVEDGNAISVAFDNASLWDVLIKVYEIFGVRWVIRSAGDILQIQVGFQEVEIEHVFEYGKGNGLVSVERNNALERIITRLRGRGSERNLPADYFHTGDPDTNSFLQATYFKNLMPKSYRDYIRGYNAGSGTGSWAYNQGVSDRVSGRDISPVDYAISDKEDLWGISYGAIEPNEQIYPTLQGATRNGVRLDEVLSVEQVLVDGVREPQNIIAVGLESGSHDTAVGKCGDGGTGTVRGMQNCWDGLDTLIYSEKFAVSNPINTFKTRITLSPSYVNDEGLSVSTQFGDSYKFYHTTVLKLIDYSNNHTSGEVIRTYTISDVDTYQWVLEDIPVSDEYRIRAEIRWSAQLTRHDINPDRWSEGDNSGGPVVVSLNTRLTGAMVNEYARATDKGEWKETFDIEIRDVWGIARNEGESDEDYTYRVWSPRAVSEDVTVMFSDGLLAGEDYEFSIVGFNSDANDLRQTIITAIKPTSDGGWKLTLQKSDAELEAGNIYLPNTQQNAKPGDHFFFVNISMPYDPYVYDAEARLLAYLDEQLALKDEEFPSFTITPSRIFCSSFAEADKIQAGAKIRVRNTALVGDSYISLYIQSLTKRYSANSLNPEWSLTISDLVVASGNPVETLQGEVDVLNQRVYSNRNAVKEAVRSLGSTFLRKDGISDVSYSPTEFRKQVRLGEGVTDKEFISGDISGKGFGVYTDNNGNRVVEADVLVGRIGARFNEVQINQVSYSAGKQVFSAAGMVIDRVEDVGTSWRCYFDTKNGTVRNYFAVNDGAFSQRFTDAGIRQYWARVTAIGADYIDISKTDRMQGSFDPIAGDNVAQLGNSTDKSRQAALMIDETHEGGGLVTWYDDITDFTLSDKDSVNIGRIDGKTWLQVYGSGYIGDREGAQYVKYENGVLQIRGRLEVGTKLSDGRDLEQAINEATPEGYEEFVEEVTKGLDSLQQQVDGAIESYFEEYEPTLENYPANEWDTDAEKEAHLNDTFTNLTDGRSWRWTTTGWVEITDTATTKALAIAGQAKDTADGKRRVFIDTPYPPYDEGDLWAGGSDAPLRRCINARETGSFNAEDWDYADSTQEQIAGYEYLRRALGESTTVEGGLIQSSLLMLGYTKDGVFNIMSGTNGLYDATKKGGGIAAWYGGPMADVEDDKSLVSYAQSLFRFDGSGYLAGGNISWDKDGAGSVAGGDISWDKDGIITLGQAVKISGDAEETLGSILGYINEIFSFIGLDKNGDVYIKGTRNFYTEGGTISMFGLGEGDSGEVASVSIKFEGSDDVYSAVEGIITLPAYPSGGGVADSVAWSNVTGKPDFATVATSGKYSDLSGTPTIPTDNNQLTNGAGYITSSALNGYAKLTDIPTSLPASDVYAWAKAATKPSYAFSEIMGKPTTLGGYGITDAITTNGFVKRDLSDATWGTLTSANGFTPMYWLDSATGGGIGISDAGGRSFIQVDGDYYANEGRSLVLHTANFSNYALPLSGGTLTGRLYIQGDGIAWMTFKSSTQTFGNIGMNETGPKYWDGSASHSFIHSGNIGSQSVNFSNYSGYISEDKLDEYLSTKTASISGWYDWGNNTGDSFVTYSHGLRITSPDSDYYVYLGFDAFGGEPKVRYVQGGLGEWNTIALTTSNVASATKLQTGRYLWNNYFNGENDVNGRPWFKVSSADASINVDIASIIVGPVNSSRQGYSSGVGFNGLLGYGGYDNHLHGWIGLNGWYSSAGAETYALVFAVNDNTNYGSVLTERMRITPNGNVLIGTTTDSGSKLKVEGSAMFNNAYFGGDVAWGPSLGAMKEGSIGLAIYNSMYGLWAWTNASSGNSYLQVARTDTLTDVYNLLLQPYGGNVIIGKTTDNGHKLQVNGSITTTEWLYGGNNYGMYIIDTGVYYSNHATYANIESAGNEICIGGNTGDSIYVNYRVPRHYGIAPTSWIWCAGSSNSRASFFIGELRSYGIHASGDLVVTGTIAMGTLSSSSDARLKDNIELLTEDESLAVLRQLRPSKWNWKSNGALSYGFIAQEVEEIASCMVDRMNDEELGQKLYLQYNQLHAFEVGAIQYIDSEVETLKRRVNELENELKQYRLCQ